MYLTSQPSMLVTHLAIHTQTYHTSPHTPMRKQARETELLAPCALNNAQYIYNNNNNNNNNNICHGVDPLVDPFRSHVSRSLFKGLP